MLLYKLLLLVIREFNINVSIDFLKEGNDLKYLCYLVTNYWVY